MPKLSSNNFLQKPSKTETMNVDQTVTGIRKRLSDRHRWIRRQTTLWYWTSSDGATREPTNEWRNAEQNLALPIISPPFLPTARSHSPALPHLSQCVCLSPWRKFQLSESTYCRGARGDPRRSLIKPFNGPLFGSIVRKSARSQEEVTFVSEVRGPRQSAMATFVALSI